MNHQHTLTLGQDREVRRLGFGAMRITGPGIWAEPIDREACLRLLERVAAAGVNLIDTADSYGPEVSEKLIAEALHPYPQDLVIATKGGLTRPGPSRWERDCRPERLKNCCDASLTRLKIDQIELYQLHAVDPEVPLQESIGALAELQSAGKIRHIGVCNVTVEELEAAREVASIVSVQNLYNLADRSSESVLEVCERDGLAFLPWFPLATGELTRPGGRLDQIASAHRASPAQVALAWLLAHSPAMVPIPGTSSVDHFDENLGAEALELSPEEIASLDSIAPGGAG
jgi:pyridoxine 4-dehydrogenase